MSGRNLFDFSQFMFTDENLVWDIFGRKRGEVGWKEEFPILLPKRGQIYVHIISPLFTVAKTVSSDRANAYWARGGCRAVRPENLSTPLSVCTSTKAVMRTATLLCIALSATLARRGNRNDKKGKPNIVVILADDLGWNEISWNNPRFSTPNLQVIFTLVRWNWICGVRNWRTAGCGWRGPTSRPSAPPPALPSSLAATPSGANIMLKSWYGAAWVRERKEYYILQMCNLRNHGIVHRCTIFTTVKYITMDHPVKKCSMVDKHGEIYVPIPWWTYLHIFGIFHSRPKT